VPGYLATGQFTGMITQFRNQTIHLGLQPVVTLIHETAGNDEFRSRVGTDDSTKRHFIQLIEACDRSRRLITWNPDNVDIRTVAGNIIDPNKGQAPSLKPINLDGIQMSSTPEIELPWRFDGTDPNIPLASTLRFRNGVGGVIYMTACQIAVNYTRLESRNRSHMITVNDSLRMFSIMQTFRDLCDRLLGEENQVDVAQPLATDEPTNSPLPNRMTEAEIKVLSSTQNIVGQQQAR
jgi:hypothetical protein